MRTRWVLRLIGVWVADNLIASGWHHTGSRELPPRLERPLHPRVAEDVRRGITELEAELHSAARRP